MHKYAEVVLDLPLYKIFHYEIPANFQDIIKKGHQVLVPFGALEKTGYVVGLLENTEVKNIKFIKQILLDIPVIPEELLELAYWMSDYYLCSLGEALATVLPFKNLSTSRDLERDEESIDKSSDVLFSLTQEQKNAIDVINENIVKNRHDVFLLHGVTSSGKTEVYIRAIETALSMNKSCIVLVPEIALTVQIEQRLKERFGNLVSIIHSDLLGTQKKDSLSKIISNEKAVVIGARSALFAPVKNLGLIILDEEHENTFKQSESPRYDARDVALKRASLCGATVIFGTATPSLESFYRASCGVYKLVSLPYRVDNANLPSVKIIDMKHHILKGRIPIVSRDLEIAISSCLEKSHQAILFLNRRGFSTFLSCKKCGFVLDCKNCSISLTYHNRENIAVCHYCGYEIVVPDLCPECKKSKLSYLGLGTQKLESEICRLFPTARVERFDSDSTKKRDSYRQILGRFRDKQIDILIGTQMVAKGHDFPNVTVVGILSVDMLLNFPDFRSAERTFNLLTQASGRAGRGKVKGEVIIQTYNPTHYAVTTAINHDYKAFYEKDIHFRKQLSYPPFSQMINISFRGKNSERVKKSILDFFEKIKHLKSVNFELLGPSEDDVWKMKGYYRWSIVCKNRFGNDGRLTLKKVISEYKRPSGILIAIDVDPK